MRRRFLVAGRVQGVGFRAFVLRAAGGLGLTGYCRNLADGRVEVVADGGESGLLALESELCRGPRLALVTHVENADISDEMTGYNGFTIK